MPTLDHQRPHTQIAMNLRDPRFRPLVNTNAAMAMLDVEALEVDSLRDLGKIIGFNIAIDKNGRKELRVLTRSIELYRRSLGPCGLPPEERLLDVERDWEKIFALLLPPGGRGANRPFLTGVEMQRSLNCDSDHVLNLIEAKLLAIVKGTNWGKGRGATPSITVSSYEKFLRGRVL